MKVELFGSLGIFLLYAFTQDRVRLLWLAIAGAAVLLWFPDTYMGFVFGAALYEAHRRDLLRSAPALLPVFALVVAIVLGGLGHGAHMRLDLVNVPEAWHVGRSRGVMNGVAAALLIYSVLTLPKLAQVFARPVPVFLGRISFGLYLVHVPPLYTVVAWSYLQGVPEIILGPAYMFGVLVLAWGFTLMVDEPSLKWLSMLRTSKRLNRINGVSRWRTLWMLR